MLLQFQVEPVLLAPMQARAGQGRWNNERITGRNAERLDKAAQELAHENLMPVQADAVKTAVTALTDAADEDRATGGIDLQRGIYSIIKLAILLFLLIKSRYSFCLFFCQPARPWNSAGYMDLPDGSIGDGRSNGDRPVPPHTHTPAFPAAPPGFHHGAAP